MKAALVALLLIAAAPSDEINFTAASVNVAEPGTPVKIKILRFSKDDERAPLLAALKPAPSPAIAARNPNAATAGAEAARGRGAAVGRGRGRGRGGPAAPLSPIAAFTAALGRAPTIGYLWTSDITGYSIKYAYQTTMADGGERIILATDRRLGAYTNAWKTTAQMPETDYAFTVIELRMDPKGATGEAKTSLTSKIAVDDTANTIEIENYPAAVTYLSRLSRSTH
jgi:hypothetical protein